MYRSQRLGLKYLTASTVMFGAMVAFGVLSSIYYIWPGFLLNVFNFNTAKIVHIDGLVIWLLMGFLGAIYWFLPQELDREVEGIALAEILFWVFCAAVAVVGTPSVEQQASRGHSPGPAALNVTPGRRGSGRRRAPPCSPSRPR